MAAKVLQLKNRPSPESLTFQTAYLRALVDSGDHEVLYRALAPLTARPGAIHDKAWLEMITSWVPKGKGLSPQTSLRWAGLALRVERLDDTREGPFTLSGAQEELLWSRIKDPEFEPMTKLTPQWAAFLLDYLAATGRHFEALSDGDLAELMADPDAVPHASP